MISKSESMSGGGKIIFHKDFGYSVFGNTIGSAWMSAVECVLKNGLYEPDESRNRIALQGFRLKSQTQILPDEIIKRYAIYKSYCKQSRDV